MPSGASILTTHNHPKHTPSSPSSLLVLNAAECRDGTLQVSRQQQQQQYTIAYKVFRPMTLSSQKAAPILVLHGGPGVPSDYLVPLVDVVPYRAIVFYDQLGCGKSEQPDDKNVYSIEQSVDDLEALIKKVGLRKFHLFGQSFGGILGYEYLKRRAEKMDKSNNNDDGIQVLSFTIASTPTSVPLVEQEVQGLLKTILSDNNNNSQDVEQLFEQQHICRMDTKPQALMDAYAHAGTIWRGTEAIANYVAEPPSETAQALPPAMVLRGEHDFVTEACVKDWKQRVWNHNRIREKVVSGCSHHALLENGLLYGEMIDSYCTEYDP